MNLFHQQELYCLIMLRVNYKRVKNGHLILNQNYKKYKIYSQNNILKNQQFVLKKKNSK